MVSFVKRTYDDTDVVFVGYVRFCTYVSSSDSQCVMLMIVLLLAITVCYLNSRVDTESTFKIRSLCNSDLIPCQ